MGGGGPTANRSGSLVSKEQESPLWRQPGLQQRPRGMKISTGPSGGGILACRLPAVAPDELPPPFLVQPAARRRGPDRGQPERGGFSDHRPCRGPARGCRCSAFGAAGVEQGAPSWRWRGTITARTGNGTQGRAGDARRAPGRNSLVAADPVAETCEPEKRPAVPAEHPRGAVAGSPAAKSALEVHFRNDVKVPCAVESGSFDVAQSLQHFARERYELGGRWR